MQIKLLDLTRQYSEIKGEIEPFVKEIMNSQQFINGPVVKKFEENFASYCGTKHAVGVSSGTDALLIWPMR